MKTTIREYCFDIRNPEQKTAYEELRTKLKAQGLKCFETHGGDSHYQPSLNGKQIELETSSLFKNQWNTAPIDDGDCVTTGRRVFDWAQDYNSNIGAPQGIKRGHWLEQTAEMAEVRRNTLKCGYCGKQEAAAKGYIFCSHCLDSEHLKEENLLQGATRLVPVERGTDWQPLTEAESAHLLPLYRDAQIHGSTERGRARIAQQRIDIEKEFNKETRAAKTERDGLIWLLDNGIKIDNVIYYDHKDMFSFGWRNPVSASVRDAILDVISEFPFEYEIKAEDKVYSGRE